eukprot:1162128-Pelagomonas_calceolata.AAC.2
MHACRGWLCSVQSAIAACAPSTFHCGAGKHTCARAKPSTESCAGLMQGRCPLAWLHVPRTVRQACIRCLGPALTWLPCTQAGPGHSRRAAYAPAVASMGQGCAAQRASAAAGACCVWGDG